MKTAHVDVAMHMIVDAVTSCRFEVTDPASEEVVLMEILQVMLDFVRTLDLADEGNSWGVGVHSRLPVILHCRFSARNFKILAPAHRAVATVSFGGGGILEKDRIVMWKVTVE